MVRWATRPCASFFRPFLDFVTLCNHAICDTLCHYCICSRPPGGRCTSALFTFRSQVTAGPVRGVRKNGSCAAQTTC